MIGQHRRTHMTRQMGLAMHDAGGHDESLRLELDVSVLSDDLHSSLRIRVDGRRLAFYCCVC